MNLINEQIPSHPNTKIPNTIIKFLLFFANKFRGGFLVLISTAAIYATCQTLFPYFIKIIINLANQITNKNLSYQELTFPVFSLCALWTIMQVMVNIQGWYIYKVIPGFKTTIKQSVFAVVSSYYYEFFTLHGSGAITKKINDLANSSERIVQLFIFNFISVIVSLFLSLVLIYHVSPIFSGLMFAWYMLHISTAVYFIRQGINYEANYVSTFYKTNGFIGDILSNILNVKLFNKLAFENNNLIKMHETEMKSHRFAITYFEKLKLLQSCLAIIFLVSTVLLLLHFMAKKVITVGDFAMVLLLAFSAVNFIWHVLNQLTIFARELGTLRSSLKVIDYNQVQVLTINHQGPLFNHIVFEKVEFSYNKNLPILKNLSLAIRPGDKIGIIGRSGLGKTTIINLLLGIYEQDLGKILLDNKNLCHITKESLYNLISVVAQDIKLLNRSIKENIKYGNSSATNEEIYAAAKMTCCHEFIEELPFGYDTTIGENGIKLSGGQRQRLALARMIVKDSPVIIMDEPSSALDELTEKQICQNIKKYLGGKTVIIVSHKSAFLQLVNKIYEFENGQLNFVNSSAPHDLVFS